MTRVTALILAIAAMLGGCSKRHEVMQPLAPQSTVDIALRTYLGVRTLEGKFALPGTVRGYFPIIVLFADGKEVAREVLPLYGTPGNSRGVFSGDIQLLYPAESNPSGRAEFVDGLNEVDLTAVYPHWAEIAKSGNVAATLSAFHIEYQGISVVGFLASTPGARSSPSIPPGDLAGCAKYVVVTGVVSGDDYDAVRAKFQAFQRVK